MIFHFEEGERAYKRHTPRNECPHEEGTRERDEWLAGWDSEDYAESLERRAAREEYERDMEPYLRPHQDGDVAT